MALVGSSCIDRYEAHLVLADHPEIMWPPYARPVPEEKYRARSLPGVLPQGYVSRPEAAAACAHADKRLCTAREWQTACKGPHGYLYPYGAEETKGRCNTGKPHLPQKLFGPDVMTNTEANFNSPRLAQEPGFLAKTGEYSGCVGTYGVFDLVGNLHEWVADDVNGALPRKIPMPYGPQGMGRLGSGVFMGGYFSSRREHGRGCEYVTTHHAPGYHDYSTGFRCCRDALPNRG
jgi:formylglycine-generating enzyme required for sulfatase activity